MALPKPSSFLFGMASSSQAGEEIEQRLPVRRTQGRKSRRGCRALPAVRVDGVGDRAGSPVVQKMCALRDAPERCGAELASRGRALLEAVGESRPHVVEQEVCVGAYDSAGAGERGRVTLRAAD